MSSDELDLRSDRTKYWEFIQGKIPQVATGKGNPETAGNIIHRLIKASPERPKREVEKRKHEIMARFEEFEQLKSCIKRRTSRRRRASDSSLLLTHPPALEDKENAKPLETSDNVFRVNYKDALDKLANHPLYRTCYFQKYDQKTLDTIAKLIKSIRYSNVYSTLDFDYRHVILPKNLYKIYVPDEYKNLLLLENEWRDIGISQSDGWEHYMLHKPEPVFLFVLF